MLVGERHVCTIDRMNHFFYSAEAKHKNNFFFHDDRLIMRLAWPRYMHNPIFILLFGENVKELPELYQQQEFIQSDFFSFCTRCRYFDIQTGPRPLDGHKHIHALYHEWHHLRKYKIDFIHFFFLEPKLIITYHYLVAQFLNLYV